MGSSSAIHFDIYDTAADVGTQTDAVISPVHRIIIDAREGINAFAAGYLLNHVRARADEIALGLCDHDVPTDACNGGMASGIHPKFGNVNDETDWNGQLHDLREHFWATHGKVMQLFESISESRKDPVESENEDSDSYDDDFMEYYQ